MKFHYLTISLLLHLSLLLLTVDKKLTATDPEEVTVELQEGSESEKGRDVQIKEMNGEGDEEAKNYYWGLGIRGTYNTYNGISVYEIIEVYSGYNGENAGLLSGDIIYLVNGKSPVKEDISGNEPKKLVIEFFRIDKISGMQYNKTINTERGKVWY